MFKVIREITFYFTFLLLLMMCAYGNQDPMSFYLKDNMIKQFVNEAYTQNETCGRKALDKVLANLNIQMSRNNKKKLNKTKCLYVTYLHE